MNKNQIQNLILKHLNNLKEELSNYEQTTHGEMIFGIDSLTKRLICCWENPTSFTISALSQQISKLKV